MTELKITIRNKVATADGQKIVCGNGDYTVHFDLDEEWADYATKTMRVVNSDRTYTDVVFTGAVANLPVLRNQSYVTIGLFAGNLHTSTPAYFNCSASILGGEGLPEAPEPDVYAQIMSLLNGAIAGLDGKDGATWWTGDDYPAGAKIGDLWLYTGRASHPDEYNLGDVSRYNGDTWVVVCSILGPRGKDGAAGHTPVKGTDYWTAEDKAEVVEETKEAIDLSDYRTAEEQDSIDAELGSLVVDIFYNGEIFFPSVPFEAIVKAAKRGRTVFAKYRNGNTFVLPLKRITNKLVYFRGSFADVAYCVIYPDNFTLLYSGKQRSSWIENGDIAVNPVEFSADVYGYTEENSLRVNLTSVHENFDQEFHMPNGETEVLPCVRTIYTADKTFSEIHEAWAGDKTIWCALDGYTICSLFSYSPADGDHPAVFVFSEEIDGDEVSGFRITSDNEVERVVVQVYESMGDDDDEEY